MTARMTCSISRMATPRALTPRTSSTIRSVSVAVRPGHHLVEQEQRGLGGERAGQLQPLALGQREAAGRRSRRPARPTRPGRRGRGPRPPPGGVPGQRADSTFSSTVSRGNGRTIWKVRARPSADLGGAEPDDRAAREADLARVGGEEPGDQREGRGLAGAVGPDERDDLALADVERQVAHGLEPAEALPDSPRPQQALTRSTGRRRSPGSAAQTRVGPLGQEQHDHRSGARRRRSGGRRAGRPGRSSSATARPAASG